MSDQVVYLMRGLPASGKSHTARKLAGATGIVLETDEYFYTQVGDDPAHYEYRTDLLPAARRWNFERFVAAINAGKSPIVVDRGNGRNPESRQYAQLAVKHGYLVELKEPESEWWQEIRVLLKYKHLTREILYQWAEFLAGKSKASHRVPVATIRHWMDMWKHDLTIADILACTTDCRDE